MATRVALVIAFLASLAPAVARADVDTTPPAVSIVTDNELMAGVEVRFDEPVKLVSATNIVLRASGATSDEATFVSCRDAAGARVGCDAGPVRVARLGYRRPLVSGMVYRVTVNPVGAVPQIVDEAGNAAPTSSRSFRGSISEQETSPGATYGWERVGAKPAYGGSFRRERTRGAKVSLRFTGTSVTWYTVKGHRYGRATVYIDGARVGVFDHYSSEGRYRVRRRFTGLTDGRHRLTIVVRGERGHRAATGTYVAVDAFRVEDTLVSSSAAQFRWAPVARAAASGDRFEQTDRPSGMSFRFFGKGIDWYTVTGPSMGKARIVIDGRRVRTVDNYSSSARYAVRRSVAGLEEGMHTLRIEPTGEERAAATGSFVAIDRLVVRLPSLASFKKLGVWVDLWDYSLNPENATASMASRGVRTLFLQTARYNSDADIAHPELVGRWIDAAHARGIMVVGWYLPAYDQYLDRDVRRTVAIARFRSPSRERFDALAVDIEYKGATESLDEFNDGIRRHLARVRLAVGNSYPVGAIVPAPLGMARAPSSWTGFPWSSIGIYADSVLPMGYWSYRLKDGSCADNDLYCAYKYTKGNIERARAYTQLPVHEIGGIADEVTAGQVADFARATVDARAIGGSLYDYRTTKSWFWDDLEPIRRL